MGKEIPYLKALIRNDFSIKLSHSDSIVVPFVSCVVFGSISGSILWSFS